MPWLQARDHASRKRGILSQPTTAYILVANPIAETGDLHDRDGRIPGLRSILAIDAFSAVVGGTFGILLMSPLTFSISRGSATDSSLTWRSSGSAVARATCSR